MDFPTDFAYAWRFTDANYHALPASDLDMIHVLSKESSMRFWNAHIENNIKYHPISRIYFDNRMMFKECGWGDDEKEARMRDELSKLIPLHSNIYFLWGPQHTIRTTGGIFIKYWTDFCYPSDYGNVIYVSESKIYVYHEDAFLEAVRKG